jgi:hypothetical protein
MINLVYLLCFTSIFAVFAFADVGSNSQQPFKSEEVKANARQFLAMATRVNNQETELPINSKFASYQAWTLKYQKYAGSNEAGDFRRVFVVPSSVVTLAQLRAAYVKYGKEATTLSEELLPKVHEHISMFTEDRLKADYISKFRGVMDGLFPDDQGGLREFQVFDCDYTSQPMNAFWYTMHATRLLDQYGTALFGWKWHEAREELRQKQKIKTIDEMRKAIESQMPAMPIVQPKEEKRRMRVQPP